jgi:hypothetical protein
VIIKIYRAVRLCGDIPCHLRVPVLRGPISFPMNLKNTGIGAAIKSRLEQEANACEWVYLRIRKPRWLTAEHALLYAAQNDLEWEQVEPPGHERVNLTPRLQTKFKQRP